MKLNLLPKSIGKNVQSRTVFMVMLVLVFVSFAGAFLMSQAVSSEVEVLKTEANAKEPLAAEVVRTSEQADQIIAQAQILLTNQKLVAAIDEANFAYPDLYDELVQYIPSFFRVRTLDAASSGPDTAVVTISGYLQSFQNYSDMMISLLRFPGTIGVGRSGFGPVAPDDEGPFGYDPLTTDRGPIPGWSATTFTMQIQRNLQAPDPRATLQAAAGNIPPAGGTPPMPTGGGPTGPGAMSDAPMQAPAAGVGN